MFILGYFLGADIMSIPVSPADVGVTDALTVQNGIFDSLYATNSIDIIPSAIVPSKWDKDTVLGATFNNSTNAGNVDWTPDTVNEMLIKRKRVDDFDWTTIYAKNIEDIKDFDIDVGIDKTPYKGSYQYAVVPITKDGIEGIYSIADELEVDVQHLTILDSDAVYHTIITNGEITIVDNMPSATVTTMYNKYPTIVRNTNANYQTIELSGTFLPEKNECDFEFDDTVVINKYTQEFKRWLTNGKTKMLKTSTGGVWLGYLTTPPTDNAYENIDHIRTISFGLTEIGDPTKEKDLYVAGLIDKSVDSKYWNS